LRFPASAEPWTNFLSIRLQPSGLGGGDAALSAPVVSWLSLRAEANRIVFRRPVLPGFLSEITLTGLSLHAGRVNVQVRRAQRGFVVEVLDRSAAIEVLTVI
jgi:hypothetical protein